VDLDTFRWLLTAAGQNLLTRAEAEYVASGDALKVGVLLRDHATPEQAAAAMTQVKLRRKAIDKFGSQAAALYFLPDALEQATRQRVARHRAARVAMAEPSSVLDLGCGIGGDLIAFASTGLTVAGVEKDPLRAAIADANLKALGLAGAVAVADGTSLDLAGFGIVFLDPARRNARGRTFNPDDFVPPWSFVETLFHRPSCVKLAPGLPHSMVPDGVEAEWVSDDGDLKEVSLWSSYLATVNRRATLIHATGMASITDEDDPGTAEVTAPRRFLYEPDDAVIRAGLVTAVAALTEGSLLDSHIAYVTSDNEIATPLARGFEVAEVLPFHEKQLRAALRERNIGTLTIKKRGVDVIPEVLRKRLALNGDETATIVLTRCEGKGVALLVNPLPSRH
jgi:SAM-dependent methyltransferase